MPNSKRLLGIEEHNAHYCVLAQDKPREVFKSMLDF